MEPGGAAQIGPAGSGAGFRRRDGLGGLLEQGLRAGEPFGFGSPVKRGGSTLRSVFGHVRPGHAADEGADEAVAAAGSRWPDSCHPRR